MLTLTIEEIMKKYQLNESQVGLKVGLSVSMISKLKNGGVSVTEETQQKFYKAFKCEIMSPQLRIKRAYDSLMIEYVKLEQKYNALSLENEENKRMIRQIKEIMKNAKY